MAETDLRYQLGLSLSGAVSAGAYSAGVVDFLLQALDAWEAAAAHPAFPAPSVGLKTFSGASAGAITAAIAAISLAADPEPALFPSEYMAPGQQKYRYRFRRLHEAWVLRPALVSSVPGEADLLSLHDLHDGKVLSLLNSQLLDEIAGAALRVCAAPSAPRAYVSEKLHIYFTLSNLRGTPYRISFKGGEYGMMQHGDRAHFALTGLGTWCSPSPFADTDSATRMDAKTLFDPAFGAAWSAYGNAALASAAFPIGLAPRLIPARFEDYAGRRWPLENWPAFAGVEPDFRDPWKSAHAGGFAYTAIDGGVIDNDPFEYALYTLLDAPGGERTSRGLADRGVIMIAPFPEPPRFPADGMPAPGLLSAYFALMPALQNQVRFKPQTLALAGDEHVGSRFMISPSRQVMVAEADGGFTEIDARYPIASGLLFGFGGFVAEIFREHDFQLGRRNCQRFLQTTFLLPQTNPIVAASFARVADRAAYQWPGLDGLPLIPLLGDAAEMVPAPQWPRITEAELGVILVRLRTRLCAVAKKLLAGRPGLPLLFLAWPLAWGVIFWLAYPYLRRVFLADLVRRDQIAEWVLPEAWRPAGADAASAVDFFENARAVIGALLDPGFDLRSEAGIASTCHVPPAQVTAVIDLCEAAAGAPYRMFRTAWRDGAGSPLVCLNAYRPHWLKRRLGLRHAGKFFFAPRFDSAP